MFFVFANKHTHKVFILIVALHFQFDDCDECVYQSKTTNYKFGHLFCIQQTNWQTLTWILTQTTS